MTFDDLERVVNKLPRPIAKLLSSSFVRYVIGGCIAASAHLTVVATLVELGGMDKENANSIGFVVGVFCSLVGTQIVGEFGPLVTLRIALASGLAFLTAQLLDVAIFNRMRDTAWWRAPLASTLVGATVDTALFFSIAFSGALSFLEPANDVSWAGEMLPMLGAGPVAPLWVSLAVADWMVKIALALLALIPFRLIVLRFRENAAQT